MKKRTEKNNREVPVEWLHEMFIYEQATGKLRWWKEGVNSRAPWLSEAGTPNRKGYRQVQIRGTLIVVHRVVWAMHTGQWPEDEIDHIDGDRSNNRLENLRVVTTKENRRNQCKPRTNTSGAIGVYWQRRYKKWIAQIKVDRNVIYLGCFDTLEEAVAARKAADTKYGFHPNHGRDRRANDTGP